MAHNYSPDTINPQARSIQAWQMNPEQWVSFCAHRYAEVFHEQLCPLAKRMAIIMHHIAVRDALLACEDVAYEVYSHYPELISSAPEYSGDEELSYDSNGGA